MVGTADLRGRSRRARSSRISLATAIPVIAAMLVPLGASGAVAQPTATPTSDLVVTLLSDREVEVGTPLVVAVQGDPGSSAAVGVAPGPDVAQVQAAASSAEVVLDDDGAGVVNLATQSLQLGDYVVGPVLDGVVSTGTPPDELLLISVVAAATSETTATTQTEATTNSSTPTADVAPEAVEPEDLSTLADRLPEHARDRFDADGDGVFSIPTPVIGGGGAGEVPAGLEPYYTQDLDLSHEHCSSMVAAPTLAELPDSIECGYVIVPIDASDPASGNIALAMTRIPASGTAQGSLLWNPGGPGGSGLTYNGSGVDVAGLSENFDLVGFDPRGVGSSIPFAHCISDAQRDEGFAETSYGLTVEEIEALSVEEAREYAEACFVNTGAILGLDADGRNHLVAHLGTRDAVQDVDLLRSVLGDARLHYLGTSYGTQLGYVYAQLFPQNVGRLVLDAAVDPAPDTSANEDGFTPDEVSLIAQGAGFQNTFEQFALQCSQRGTQNLTWAEAYGGEEYLELRDGSPFSYFWDALKDEPFSCPLGDGISDTAELSATSAALLQSLDAANDGQGLTTLYNDGRKLTSASGRQGVIQTLYSESLWSALAYGLWEAAELETGTALLTLADLYRGRNPDGTYGPGDAAFTTIRCTDSNSASTPFDVDHARRVSEAYYEASPFQQYGPVTGSPDPCSYWPFPGTQPPSERLTEVPNILVVSTSHDSATPYASGVSLARTVEGTLLSVAGASHGAFGNGLACVDDTVVSYLTTGVVPEPGPLGPVLDSPDSAILPDGSTIELPNRCQVDSFRPSGFSLSAGAGRPSDEIAAALVHLASNADYTIEFAGQPGGTVATNNGGNGSLTLTVPADVPAGFHSVVLRDSSGAVAAEVQFLLLGAGGVSLDGVSPGQLTDVDMSQMQVAEAERRAVATAQTLPRTGTEMSAPWVVLTALLLLSIGLMMAVRHRGAGRE